MDHKVWGIKIVLAAVWLKYYSMNWQKGSVAIEAEKLGLSGP